MTATYVSRTLSDDHRPIGCVDSLWSAIFRWLYAGDVTEQPTHERADSRRKRLRLVAAAREAVAEHGLDVSAAEIAARAEVGVGTLYRRFGSKEALIQDVLIDGLAEVQAAADEALADPDPWSGLSRFLIALTEAQVVNRGVAEFTSAHTKGLPPEAAARAARLADAIKALTSRAQAAGAIRPDVNWRDIVMLSWAPIGADECLGARAGDEQWRRTMGIALDGLRTPSPEALPPA
jgi:AcrR family transcriptional regulator